MPDDSAGNASRPSSPVPVTGQGADSPQVNVPIDDIYACLNRRHFSDGRKPFGGNQNFNGYKAVGAANATEAQDYVTLAQVQAIIASIQGVPAGALVAMTGTAIPAGYLLANGQSVLRATYAALWTYAQASGNLAATQGAKTPGQYGPGDGSTTFTLPDLATDGGQFIRPLASSGRTIGSSQADELKAHLHIASFAGNFVPDHVHGGLYVVAGSGFGIGGGGNTGFSSMPPAGGHTPSGTVAVTNTGGAETRPKNIAYPYVIKT